jgi:hypothetical protein
MQHFRATPFIREHAKRELSILEDVIPAAVLRRLAMALMSYRFADGMATCTLYSRIYE